MSRAPRLLKRIAGITRFEIVKRYRDHPDFDVALTLPDHHKSQTIEAALGNLCESRQRTEWFFRYKYILSLAGIDTGSNFLMAANSQSVVMKEEDGWELFYTDLFKPWEHYIPLERGAGDVEEKLEWARANEKACLTMSAASREVCKKLASPSGRQVYLTQIVECYRGLKQ